MPTPFDVGTTSLYILRSHLLVLKLIKCAYFYHDMETVVMKKFLSTKLEVSMSGDSVKLSPVTYTSLEVWEALTQARHSILFLGIQHQETLFSCLAACWLRGLLACSLDEREDGIVCCMTLTHSTFSNTGAISIMNFEAHFEDHITMAATIRRYISLEYWLLCNRRRSSEKKKDTCWGLEKAWNLKSRFK